MVSAEVENSVNRIQPQCIDVEVLDPVEGVLDEEPAHGVAVRPIEVDRFSPGRLVPRSEIGTEGAQVVSFRPEVVVDNVERDRQSASMGRVDESLQASRSSVAVLCGERIYAVIAPI